MNRVCNLCNVHICCCYCQIEIESLLLSNSFTKQPHYLVSYFNNLWGRPRLRKFRYAKHFMLSNHYIVSSFTYKCMIPTMYQEECWNIERSVVQTQLWLPTKIYTTFDSIALQSFLCPYMWSILLGVCINFTNRLNRCSHHNYNGLCCNW